MRILSLVLLALALGGLLWLLDRAALAAERRGWIFYRRTRASGNALGAVTLELQKILESGKAAHVIEAQAEPRRERPDPGGDRPPGYAGDRPAAAADSLERPMSLFHHSRDLPATPAEVFAAFADPARLARWWGPAGFRNSFETFEFREGGAWTFVMHGPDGTDYPNQAEFLEIVPDSRIRLRHTNLPHFELTLALEPRAAGTRVDWRGVFENREFAESMRGFLESANEQNLDRLAAEVAAG